MEDMTSTPFRSFTDGEEAGVRHSQSDVYELLWQHSPNATIFTDAGARIRMVNPAAETLFGIPKGMLTRKSMLELFSNRRGDPERGTIPAMLEKHGEITNFETYVVRPDGMRLAVSLHVQRVVDDRKRLVGYLGTVHDVTSYVRKIYTDPLTGLGNRRAFESALRGEVNRALVEQAPLGLLWVDLDHFKVRNKQFGYDVCDEYLKALAGALVRIVPPLNPFYPRVFRWGGDEEPVLLNDPETVCMEIAQKIVEDVRGVNVPCNGGSKTFITTASIGIAMLSDVDPRGTPEAIARELARKAGRAVFAAKDRGRDRTARWQREV